jgi:hypothetical protein
MDAGEIFARIVMYGALVAGGSWVVWMMSNGRDQAVEDHAWGDFPWLSEEAKAAANINGEGGCRRENGRLPSDTHHSTSSVSHSERGAS